MPAAIAVIGARLNSSRLPRKHLLDLAGSPLIARIFQRLERVPELDRIILATTNDDYNRPLVHWAEGAGKAVAAYDGDVNDLVGRIDWIAASEQPGILVYVCGDSPLVEPTTISAMIRILRDNPDAELAGIEPHQGRPVIHEGFSVYSGRLWRRLVAASEQPHEREHVGSALQKFADPTPMALIRDDPQFFKLKHRLSVDTPSDYRFMSEAYRRWYHDHGEETIVSLSWLIDLLELDDRLRAINTFVRQKRVLDRSVPVLLATAADQAHGLGHLCRSLAAAAAFQNTISAGVRLLIAGKPIQRPDLQLLPSPA